MTSTCVDLERLIAGAISKVEGKKENDLCRYLPMVAGGYMHHFTLRKMKNQGPDRLADMIQKYIIDVENPLTVKPKQRAARGSRKKKGQIVLGDSELEHLLQLARAAGEKDLVRKLLPRKDLKVIKRELIRSVRDGLVNHNLWNTYVEAIT